MASSSFNNTDTASRIKRYSVYRQDFMSPAKLVVDTKVVTVINSDGGAYLDGVPMNNLLYGYSVKANTHATFSVSADVSRYVVRLIDSQGNPIPINTQVSVQVYYFE